MPLVKCHRGHETDSALWNCPVCTDRYREENIRLRKALKAILSTDDNQLDIPLMVDGVWIHRAKWIATEALRDIERKEIQ